MKIQQFDPRMVSITQVRRDIGALERVLEKEGQALVVKNQEVMFVASKPEKYKRMEDLALKQRREAVEGIRKLREAGGKKKGSPATDYVIKMRDEQASKWTQR